MVKRLTFLAFTAMLLFVVVSCDSLWVVNNSASISFDLQLKDILASSTPKMHEPSLIDSNSLIPDIDDEGYDVVVTLHKSSSDKVIASETLTVDEAEGSNILFEEIAVNQTVYAKIEIKPNNRLIFRARTLDTKLKRGENFLLARPNVMFLSEGGLSVSLGSDVLDIGNEEAPGLPELQFAYDYMSIDGKLLPNAEVYVSSRLHPKENEVWNLPGLTLIQENPVSVVIENIINSFTVFNMTFASTIIEELEYIPFISIGSAAILNLGGDVHIDRLSYTPNFFDSSPVRVTKRLSENSRIGLGNFSELPVGTVLVEKAGGSFTRDNFIVPTGVNAVIDTATGNLVVAGEDSGDGGDITPPDGEIYTVTFNASGGVVDPASLSVEENETIETLPTPSRDGFIFGGWFTEDNGKGTAFTSSTSVTGDITVYAKWTAVSGGSDEEVYLNVDASSSGANGSVDYPFTTFANAKAALPNGGTIWVVNTIEITSSNSDLVSDAGTLIALKRASGMQTSIIKISSGAEVTLDDIVIDGNNVSANEPLIAVNVGTLILEDGAIVQNANLTRSSISGAGISVGSDGKLIMNGGEIKSNKSSLHGGGVNVSSGSFTMNSGSITLNTATQSGGGVYVSGGDGVFTMKNGSITQNTANDDDGDNGGGVFVNNTATLNLQGAPTISENKMNGTISNGALSGGTSNNIEYYYNNGNKGNIYITGALTGNANSIYITPHDTVTGTVVATATNENFIPEGLLVNVLGDNHISLWGSGKNIVVQ